MEFGFIAIIHSTTPDIFHKQILFAQIKKLNEAFDELMIDPSN